ncbi:MAG: sulfotransferase [Rubripirellula sp.]|nr:sulfotransferase family protein [Rhodopirellula sp.]MCH1442146.1 sulfotransferase [Rubripirellula sp.]OUX08378.1 MAG: sulfotransferase family protein [Planctomycetaceae bacterium TMED240]
MAAADGSDTREIEGAAFTAEQEDDSRVGAESDQSCEKPDPSDQSSSESEKTSKAKFHHYPFYSPRFWHGMRPSSWWSLLRQGRFRIHPSRLLMAVAISFATPFNTLLALIQGVIFRRKLAEAELHGPPVFIVGHWRSGTTLLHELMVRDERLSSPSTFQCFAPCHFLVTEWFFRRFATWLLPGKRPMDNMAAGWDRPQEDEFALMNLGQPSPYRRIAFPNEVAVDMNYLDFDGVPEEEKQEWMKALRSFLLKVSVDTGRPLIIKSPTHTGRIGSLASEFPEAKFIHITRDPRALFPSTCRLWRGLDEVQALQKPTHDLHEDYVIECLRRMYKAFHEQRKSIDSARIIDVRFEDLTNNPVETLRSIYKTLRLSDFESVEETIRAWADSEHKTYQRNQHQLPSEQEALILNEWQDYFERYGYR